MFLDSEPEEGFQLPRSGMPLKEKKRTATLLPATEKIYMFLSSSPSVTKGKPFFFYSVKGSVRCSTFKFGSFVKWTFAIRFRYLLMNAVALRLIY